MQPPGLKGIDRQKNILDFCDARRLFRAALNVRSLRGPIAFYYSYYKRQKVVYIRKERLYYMLQASLYTDIYIA